MVDVRHASRWTLLVLVSALLCILLRWLAVPAALLLGPMLVGAGFALRGQAPPMPRWAFPSAQAVIGFMVAATITPATFLSLMHDWPAMLVIVSMTILFGGFVGLMLMRFGSLPGGTAAWGLSPGGAAAMTAMAEAYGADVRMVALMQYLRLFCVVLTASGVARLLLGHAATPPARQAFTFGLGTPPLALALTLALLVFSILAARRVRISGSALLLPLLLGVAVHSTGLVRLALPWWLLWATYASLGWYIGLRFDRQIVLHALKVVPQMLLGTLALILLCCGSAWLLTVWLGVDALTAYLATSPGGLDSVAVIAAGSGCDVGFVLAMQTLRLFAVILSGPLVARLICRLSGLCEK